MATRQEFCDGMNKLYEDHGMYVGTGNGERTLDVAGKFFEMEKNYGRSATPTADTPKAGNGFAKISFIQ